MLRVPAPSASESAYVKLLAREQCETEQSLSRSSLLLFTVLRALTRTGLRGSSRMFFLAQRYRLLRGVLRFSIDRHHPLYVPISRCMDLHDVLEYEGKLLSTLVLKADLFEGNSITLVDCGADIGIVSVRLLSSLKIITKILAFEPNQDVFWLLKRTLSEQPCETVALQMAVSNFSGRGELRSPDYDPHSTGRYLAPAEEGGFPVVTIDDVLTERPSYCIIKIDVEGGELSVLEGAQACIKAAKALIIVLEAHPKVTARTGIDPCSLLTYLNTQRPFEFTVAEKPEQYLDLTQPFFQQVRPDTIFNIVCSSAPQSTRSTISETMSA